MHNTVLSIPINAAVKKRAEEKAEKEGFSFDYFVSSVMDKILKDLVKKNIVGENLHITLVEEPSAYFKKALKKAEKDLKAGKGSPTFKSAKESVRWLEQQGI